MKTILNIFIALSISLLSSISTNASNNNEKEKKSIQNQVKNIIGGSLNAGIKEKFTIRASFYVNKKNEIVVMDVLSKSDKLNEMVKNKLNNQKLDIPKSQQQKVYMLPIKINKK